MVIQIRQRGSKKWSTLSRKETRMPIYQLETRFGLFDVRILKSQKREIQKIIRKVNSNPIFH